MPEHHHLTRWNPQDAGTSGYWGPVTASIDWCERNYDTRLPMAEPANTLTNLGFIALAGFGIHVARRERLPADVPLAWIGMLLVGLGSFAFHCTLQYRWQLADELPMIYASTCLLYSALAAGERSMGVAIPLLLVAYDIVVSVLYVKYFNNPVFHQVSYALTVAWTIMRTVHLLRTRLLDTPEEDRKNSAIRRIAWQGILLYGLGFAIWNVDNLACVALTRQKEYLGYPMSLLLEGHAYWHILTGLGSHYIAAAVAMLAACLSPDGHEHFQLRWAGAGLVPYVKRVDVKRD